ncbi:hypothetical protein PG997_012123 [Apiospora hydei]|uniref:Uncharacterized protein n=1 Tax=Apiospora hydei TaxID=1337664 RepID=A0ABR1V4Y6_9PEZI
MPPALFTHELLVEMLTGHPTGHLDPFPASVPLAPPASPAGNSPFLLWRRQTAYFDGGGSDDKDAMAAASAPAMERNAYGGMDGGGGGYYYGGGGGPYLSPGAIVGIVIGCIICLIILIWLCWCCVSLGGRGRGHDDRRYRRRGRDVSSCSYVRSRSRYERGRTVVVENSVCRPQPAVCNGGCRGCKYY